VTNEFLSGDSPFRGEDGGDDLYGDGGGERLSFEFLGVSWPRGEDSGDDVEFGKNELGAGNDIDNVEGDVTAEGLIVTDNFDFEFEGALVSLFFCNLSDIFLFFIIPSSSLS